MAKELLLFFRLSMASLLGGGKENTSIIALYTPLRLNYADFMIWCRHLVRSPFLIPSQGERWEVKEAEKVAEECGKMEEDPLCPFCLCNQHYPHPCPHRALSSSSALAV